MAELSGDKPNLTQQQAIDRVCDAFEQAWQAGSNPALLTFVLQVEPAARDDLAYELIVLEREYQAKSGTQPYSEKHYCESLPQYQAAVARAFAEDQKKTLALVDETLDGNATFVRPNIHSPAHVTSTAERVHYFGDYELLGELARGGMGVVYRAKQISLNRIIALKMILTGSIAGEDEIRRFQREAEAAGNLDHPGIVPIYDIGQHNGQHYYSMKLIEGRTLGQISDELKRDPSRAVALVASVADAIHHAHQRGILHRDLKPANILLDATGQPLVTDFGLARNTKSDQQLTQTGAVVGTPGFMPPEQAAGKQVTTAADIYSLGAILYHLLCGRPPHQADSVMGTLMSVMNEAPSKPRDLNPAIHPDLELICLKCLAKEPDDRYTSAGELAGDLRAFTAGEPLHVRAPSIVELMKKWLSSNFGNVLWVPVIALVIGTTAGFSLWVCTFGQDMAFSVRNYANFSPADRSWLSLNWRPAGIPVLILFLLTLTGIGWATAKLVRTKNRAADIGSGLAVGLLTGLIAFSSGMGAVLVDSQMIGIWEDRKLIGQLAATGNQAGSQADSYAQAQLATRYPTLEPLPPAQRSDALFYKITSDLHASLFTGTMIGTVVCLVWFGLLGLAETYVAGPLIRQQGRWKSLFSYGCFAFALVQILFVVGSEVTTWVICGSGYILDWPIPIASVAVSLLGIASVLTRWPWPAQFIITAAWFTLSVLFFSQTFLKSPVPVVASRRTEIRVAQQQVATDPMRREFQMRLARANYEYGRLLSGLDKENLALTHFQDSLDAIETTPVDQLESEQRWLHAAVLGDAAAVALRIGEPEQAAKWTALHSQQYASSNTLLSMYAQSVLDSKLPVLAYLAPTTATNLNAWYRVACQLRALATYKDEDATAEDPTSDQWLSRIVEQVLERTTETESDADWAAHRQRLQTWLTSRQRWDVYGPFRIGQNLDSLSALDVAMEPEAKLIAGESVTPDKVISCYAGSEVDLIHEFGTQTNAVIYARLQFQLAMPQRIRFRFGSDDGIKAWIDGDLLLRNAVTRGVYEGNDIVDTTDELPAGTHTLVLKITQGAGGWGFVLNLAEPSGWPLEYFPVPQSSD